MTTTLNTNHDVYHSLVDVESANESIRTVPHFDELLFDLGRLLKSHNLHRELGVRLLHRHNDLGDSEVMIEEAETLIDGTPALVTSRTVFSGEMSELQPLIWKCKSSGAIEPLEYCRKLATRIPDDLYIANAEFFSKFHAIVASRGLEDLLGLCLLNWHLIEHDPTTHVAVEESDSVRVANIVTIKLRATHDDDSAITTVWDFSQSSRVRCVRQKICIPRSPGHSGEWIHDALGP